MRFVTAIILSLVSSAGFSATAVAAHVYRNLPITTTGGTSGVWIGAADFNHDGHQDVAVVEAAGKIQFLMGSTSGHFLPGAMTAVDGVLIAGTIEDFNGDGVPDLAVLVEDPESVVVLEGNHNGGFGAPVSTTLISRPDCFAAADFDGDHILDLVVADPSGISFLKGLGNGQFASPIHEEVDGLTDSHELIAVDLNHDNIPDLVLGNNGHVLLGLGDGHFTGAPTSVQPPSAATGIAASDLDGDGNIDLVFTNALFSSVDVAFGRGDGSFGALTSYAVGAGPTDVALVDVTGDGIKDIVVTSPVDRLISVLDGHANGSFSPARSYASPAPMRLATGDFLGTGRIDIAALLQTPGSPPPTEVALLPAKGGGDFDDDRAYLIDTSVPGYSVPLAADLAAVGDFNGDGHPDLAVTFHSTTLDATVAIFLNRGDGSLGQPIYLTGSVPWTSIVGLAAADFDGDGAADLAVSVEGVGTTIFLSNGHGAFSEKETLDAIGPTHAVDLDHIPGIDLVIGTKILAGGGDGTFELRLDLANHFFTEPDTFHFVDLNGDGQTDLVGTPVAGYIPVFMNFMDTGNYYFAPSSTQAASALDSLVAVADFDGDGVPDLLLQDFNDVVYFQHGNGDGTFSAGQLLFATNFRFDGPKAAFDFDGDHKTDLLLPDRILFGDGMASFTSMNTSEPSEPESLSRFNGRDLPVADFDGEGFPQLVAVEGSTVRIVRPGKPAVGGAVESTITAPPETDAVTFGDPRSLAFSVVSNDQLVPTGGVIANVAGKTLGIFDLTSGTNPPAIYPHGLVDESELIYGGDRFQSTSNTTAMFPPIVRAKTTGFINSNFAFIGAPLSVALYIEYTEGILTETPGGTVTFKDNGIPFLTAPYPASAQLLVAAGPHDITAEYSGDEDFLPTSADDGPFVGMDDGVSPQTSRLTATPGTIEVSGEPAVISLTLRDSNGAQLSISPLTVDFHTTLGTIGDAQFGSDGHYHATLSSQVAGTAIISATVDSKPIIQQISVTVTNRGVRPRGIQR